MIPIIEYADLEKNEQYKSILFRELTFDSEIEKAVRECQATMVVMGSSGKARWVERWIGSSSKKIAEDTVYPTLLIPPEKKES